MGNIFTSKLGLSKNLFHQKAILFGGLRIIKYDTKSYKCTEKNGFTEADPVGTKTCYYEEYNSSTMDTSVLVPAI